ncbi:hypothetical protein [Novosphingobium sp. 17-62-19]|uniref:hypothetical protein n=1 Tax=Novosphingobium sp. 17-62-19 TaxID=1970406 RepID=UPI0025EBC8F6|nr:hypothetical protein [Novosphingobium sp. 17-62-19]HQS98234.1 hypothetical protein [Novosphingobium sp.]
MQTLDGFFKRLSKKTAARWWVGPLPDVRTSKVSPVIAAQLSYPSGDFDPFVDGGMTQLNWSEAAYVLALAGTRSLAYGNKPPSDGVIAQAADALKVLSGKTVFLTNGDWLPGRNHAWTPLSASTFDCGVIGYDETTAFIFWIEEED